MAKTTKELSALDDAQVSRSAYSDTDATIPTSGYLTPVVGRKITLALSTTSIVNDTETYTFSENGIDLYAIKVIYTDGTRETMISAERIS